MTASTKWIDISVPIRTSMVRWPSNPEVSCERVNDINKGASSNVSLLSMGTHTGTHMDSPLHFFRDGASLDTLPFEAVIGPARVIEIEDPEAITLAELRPHKPGQGERILFKTRNSARCWKSDEFFPDFVYLSSDAGRLLVESGVRTVGVDYLSVGGYKKNGAEIHRILLEAGVWIIEGLDLSEAPAGDCELICLPMKIANGDGAPSRAILRPQA